MTAFDLKIGDRIWYASLDKGVVECQVRSLHLETRTISNDGKNYRDERHVHINDVPSSESDWMSAFRIVFTEEESVSNNGSYFLSYKDARKRHTVLVNQVIEACEESIRKEEERIKELQLKYTD